LSKRWPSKICKDQTGEGDSLISLQSVAIVNNDNCIMENLITH
jgi:hypothetical protein